MVQRRLVGRLRTRYVATDERMKGLAMPEAGAYNPRA
jgi:hypothetical protein